MYLKQLDLFMIITGWYFSLNNAAVITVKTPLGLYGGCALISRLRKTIYAFRGIRYAQPPIKELRFKPPVPVNPHDGIYDATKDGPVCPQPTKFPISEDCLLLNVYTTTINCPHMRRKKPVIAYLHAGGFYIGSGRSDTQGPQYLLDQDIVLVTINYRLATLGFLSLGLAEAPGNNGFKDQVLALKWIQNNIGAFGGDPDLVTLAGCSAGASSVALHMVSPMSEGLFHRAIISSGSFLRLIPKDQYELAHKQACIFGCNVRYETTKRLMDCLNNATAQQYADSVMKFRKFHNDPVIIWGPVIEEDFGQERFLTEHPIKSAWYGNFMKIPIMAGITTKEFGYEAVDILMKPKLLQKLNNEWEKYAPIIFMYEENSIKSKTISKGLRAAYFGYDQIDCNTSIYLQQLYADGITGFGVNRVVELLSMNNFNPVYYYHFAYLGAVHLDDLIYIFQNTDSFPIFTENDPEIKMVERWTSVWANFANTGNPLPSVADRFDRIVWEPYSANKKRYLEAGQNFEMKDGLNEQWYQVWRILFPLVDYFNLKKEGSICSLI